MQEQKELIDTIQEALTHFANVCPQCERELNIYVTEGDIKEWLKEREQIYICPDVNEGSSSCGFRPDVNEGSSSCGFCPDVNEGSSSCGFNKV